MQLDGLEIGRYRFARLLGSGGMGDVYLAEDAQIGQQVAIKVIRTEGNLYPTAQAGQEAVRLFRREAQAAARLDHPHILPLFDYGEAWVGGMTLLYLVMPYRPEGSLAAWVREHSPEKLLPPQVVAHFIRQAAEALQHAHNRQIIHQDVKAANFLLRRREEAPERPDLLLADFGIARVAATAASVSQVVRGSPSAMAPEQWQGEAVPATDQYALAVMAYELLTGHPPFQGNMMRLMHDHLHVTPPAPSTLNPLLPGAIDTVLLHALAKEPGQRFSSITAFANAFEQATRGAAPAPLAASPVTQPSPPATTVPRVPGDSGIFNAPTRTSNRLPEGRVDAPTRLPSQGPEGIYNALTRSSDQVPENIYQAPTRVSNQQPATIPAASTRISSRLPETVRVARKTVTLVDTGAAATSPVKPIAGSARRSLLKGWKRKVALAALLVLLLVGGTLGYVAAFGVTLKDTYIMTTVPDATNVLQHQVHGEAIDLQTPTYTQTVPATGPTRPATPAQGTLTLDNDMRVPVTLHQGMVLDPTILQGGTCTATVQMVLDADVTIPASPDGINAGQATVPAHTLQTGANTNIPAYMQGCFLHYSNLGSSASWYAMNLSPFTGGVDAGPTVQQSDIDGAVRSLLKANPPPDARRFLATSGDALLTSPASSCRPETVPYYNAGARVDQVTVLLYYDCTGYGYDASGVAQLATRLLIDHYGAHLTLRGKITTAVISAVLLDRQRGIIRLTVTAEGTWGF